MVESQLDEGFRTLDISIIVAHNHQIVIILLGPVVVKLDSVLGQGVVHQDLLNLLLQLLGGGPVQIVREPDILIIISPILV